MTRRPDSSIAPRWLTAVGACMMLLSTFVAGQTQHAEQVADAAAQTVVEELLAAFVGAAQLSEVDARVDFLTEPVLRSHDLDFIGQLTVRRQWREWTDAQRQQFLVAFRELSVMSYAARFASVGEDSFAVLGTERVGGSRVQVNATVARADGTRVPLDFVMQNTNDANWRIANVVADGVSDLALKRAHYSNTLQDSGFEGLIAELESQTLELADSAAD
jgi:phospholipid transport system substrate-binding protein